MGRYGALSSSQFNSHEAELTSNPCFLPEAVYTLHLSGWIIGDAGFSFYGSIYIKRPWHKCCTLSHFSLYLNLIRSFTGVTFNSPTCSKIQTISWCSMLSIPQTCLEGIKATFCSKTASNPPLLGITTIALFQSGHCDLRNYTVTKNFHMQYKCRVLKGTQTQVSILHEGCSLLSIHVTLSDVMSSFPSVQWFST